MKNNDEMIGSKEIKIVPIDLVIPYEENPRLNDKAVEYVKNSIKQFKFAQPIAVDKDGVIIAGHTRYRASKELGLESVPVVVLDYLTDEEVKAYRLADNKVAEFADWDFEKLNLELDSLLDTEISMEDFGFAFNTELEFEDEEEQEASEMIQIKFSLAPEQAEIMEGVFQLLEPNSKTYGNEDQLGNKFFSLAEQWAKMKQEARGSD